MKTQEYFETNFRKIHVTLNIQLFSLEILVWLAKRHSFRYASGTYLEARGPMKLCVNPACVFRKKTVTISPASIY